VTKHRRNLLQDLEEIERQQRADEDRRRIELERRKHESRALVQRIVLEKAKAPPGADDVDALDGITGARNAVPSDDDWDVDEDEGTGALKRDRERQDWEVREVLRLLRDAEIEMDREREAADLRRRRVMTDEDVLLEQQELQRQRQRQRQGSKAHQDEGRHQQQHRYFHKGAFFMDDSEWSEGDVRQRAAEYAQAPTGSDLVDRRKLPKVMQTKSFGRANQSKYQGLAKEDTSDRRADVLPLVYQSKGKHKK
jgi:microfibrillar-associated protein 1